MGTGGESSGEQVVVASSWRHLDDLLFEGAWDPRLHRFRSRFAFRGDSRRGRSLVTGLMRAGGDLEAKERHLVRNLGKYARRSFVGDDSVWNWLALGQHHGLPTRLIDWSYSPYVALHFVTGTARAMDADGEVWMVDLGSSRPRSTTGSSTRRRCSPSCPRQGRCWTSGSPLGRTRGGAW